MLIQPTAINNTVIATRSARPYLELLTITSSRETRQWILKNMPEIRERVGDDIGFLDRVDNDWLRLWNKAGWYGLTRLDRITASAGALSVYKQELAKQGKRFNLNDPVDPVLIQRAQTMVRATQSSSLWKDAPPALGSGYGLTGNREINRALLKFQSFMLTDFHVAKTFTWTLGWRGEHKDKAWTLWSALWIMVALSQMVAIRRAVWHLENDLAGRDDEDDRRLADSFMEDMMLEAAQKVPFVSQAISMAVYDSEPAPMLNSFAKATYGTYRFGTTLFDGKDNPSTTAKGAVDALVGFGSLAGVGGSAQIGTWFKAVIDAQDGSGNTMARPNAQSTPQMLLPPPPPRASTPPPPRY